MRMAGSLVSFVCVYWQLSHPIAIQNVLSTASAFDALMLHCMKAAMLHVSKSCVSCAWACSGHVAAPGLRR